MGAYLVDLLLRDNIEVFVTSRKQRLSQGKLYYLQGDAQDIIFLRDILCKHWDVIIDFMNYSTLNFKNRVDLLLKSTSQYIFLSSSRVYANSDKLITEESSRLLDISDDEEFLSTDEYSLAKARQEDILRYSGYNNWTIIRPYITYSENRLQLGFFEKEGWLFRALMGKTIVLSDAINSKLTTMTYGLDVAKAIVALVNNKKAIGEIFQITCEKSQSWQKILGVYLNTLEKHLGFRPKVLLVNSNLFIKSYGSKYQILYDRFFNRCFNNSKINNFVDVSGFMQIECGLDHCLKKFLQNPVFQNIDWRLEALNDKISGEKTPLKNIPTLKKRLSYLYHRYLNIKL